MSDMLAAIAPKSDQKNADDFIGGAQVLQIKSVDIKASPEQPVSIFLVGEDRPWKPCKSMSRVLVGAWGSDANAYAGRWIELYRDPDVTWGGMKVGGIRISRMSHLKDNRQMAIMLTASKKTRAPCVVHPLPAELMKHGASATNVSAPTPARPTAEQWAETHIAAVNAAADMGELLGVISKGAKAMEKLKTENPDLWDRITTAYNAAREVIMPVEYGDAPEGE